MKTYKLKLNEFQLNRLNLIENDNIKVSAMSILAYLQIYNLKKNEEDKLYDLSLTKKEPGSLKISFAKFLKSYNAAPGRKRVSLQTLKNRINLLIDLELLVKLTKIKKTNVYSFITNNIELSKNKSKNISNSENVLNEINAEKDANIKNDKYINTNNYKDYDSNSNLKTVTTSGISKHYENFNYKSYLDQHVKVGEVYDFGFVARKLNSAFKLLKVRSNYIKSTVIAKLIKYYSKITVKYIDKYIFNAISNARKDYYNNYSKYVLNNKFSEIYNPELNRTLTKYNFNNLEKALLGESFKGSIYNI